MEILETLTLSDWQAIAASSGSNPGATEALETGKLLYAPQLPFELSETERQFLTPDCLDAKSKNVSFRPGSGELRGTSAQGAERAALLTLLERYYNRATLLIKGLCPGYAAQLKPGFTSFRPAEIAGRTTSWRKDDTRLHVDAFPSRPLQGLRIMRVFTNVNPEKPRSWRVGEAFPDVAARFFPKIKPAFPGSAFFLKALHVTKERRTEYDHLMLGIHDAMKADDEYQKNAPQTHLEIPAGATWACYTDSVSHAAMAGQFVFEQTFYLPVAAMQNPARSPLRVLEKLKGHALV